MRTVKKITALVIASVILFALLLSGCGDSTDEEVLSSEDTTARSTAESTQPDESFSTIEEMVATDEMQDMLAQYREAYDSTMDVDLIGEDNKLIFEFTYKTQIEESYLQDTKESLESAFSGMSSTFENLASSVQDCVDTDKPVEVVLKILNADDSLITEMSFSAKE